MTPGDLADEDFVHGPGAARAHFHAYLLPLCREMRFQPRIVQEPFNSVRILGLVSCGMGIIIATGSIHDFGAAGLVPPIEDVSRVRVTEAVWSSGNLRLLAQQFVAFLGP